MALTFAASCSRDKDVDNQDNNKIDDTTIEEIVLGAGQSVSVTPKSRGMGQVGGLTGNNNWKGETVYVYGINTTTNTVAINGEAAKAPTDANSGSLVWIDAEKHVYYEGKDIYDFYGVHVDGAAADMSIAGAEPITFDAANGFVVDLTLDGTQDIMVAVPNKTKDITTAIEGAGASDLKPAEGDEGKLYSAWSARRNVVPNLEFSHLLTGLNFKAKCGNNEELTDKITISKIVAKEVESQISLTVIPGKEANTTQTFVPKSVPADFTLMAATDGNSDGNLDEFAGYEVVGNNKANFVLFGGGMLLVPAKEYTIEITTSQTINGQLEERSFSYTFSSDDVDAGDGGVDSTTGFQAGALYDINIIVYGLQEIMVNGTLIEWKDGGDVTIDPDQMEEDNTEGETEPEPLP